MRRGCRDEFQPSAVLKMRPSNFKEIDMLKNLYRLLVVAVFAAGLGACNTVKGVGKDIKKVGEKIEEKADKSD